MAETKINASQTTITASDIGAASAVTTMPVASATELGKIYQYVGTTTANYTNCYFYKCGQELELVPPTTPIDPNVAAIFNVDTAAFAAYLQTKSITITSETTFYIAIEVDAQTGDSYVNLYKDVESGTAIETFTPTGSEWIFDYAQLGNTGLYVCMVPEDTSEANYPKAAENDLAFVIDKSYSWGQIDVQPAPVIPDPLPTQTGNAGKFLTTDGTDASWGNTVKSFALNNFDEMRVLTLQTMSTIQGGGSTTAWVGTCGPAELLLEANAGIRAKTPALYPSTSGKTLGKSDRKWGNTYTEKINNGSDITVPAVAGSVAVQVSALPTADSTLEGQIYQFVGATDSTYTNGRFYKCVSDGQATPTYSWEEVSMGGGAVTSINGKTGVVDLSAWDVNALLQSSTAPEANIENLGKIYQLAGTGTALDGTFWKCVTDSRVISTGAVDIISFTGSIADTPLPTVNLVDTNAFDTFLQTYCEGATISQVDPLIAFEIVADEDEEGAFVSFACNNGNIGGWIDLESLTLENILTALTEMGFSVTLNGDTGFATLDGKLPFTAGTIYWAQINVQPTPDPLPDQTGNAGKFLTTDGTDASWSDKPLVNTATGTGLGVGTGSSAPYTGNCAIGINASASGAMGGTCLGTSATSGAFSVAIGYNTKVNASASVAIGQAITTTTPNTIQINASTTSVTNSDANTFKVANANGNFEIMSADGTIPSDRLVHAINKYSTMPTAASTNEGWIVQFTGTTDSTYTHGHLYECVSDGQTPATYSWTEVSMGGGGSSYTAGTGIDITSGVISVTAPTLQNVATASRSITIGGTAGYPSANNNVVVGTSAHVGYNQYSTSSGNIVIGGSAIIRNGVGNIAIGSGAGDASITSMQYGIAIGTNAKYNANYAIQLGGNTQTNSDANTFKVGNANGNFEIMSADGTVPTARLTKVNSTITLAAADWSSNTQTVTVNGVTSTSVVFVSPDPTDVADYVAGGIICTAQGTNSLTFTCSTTPANDIDVVIVAM